MSTSPLSPQEIRAAAETHDELGPAYSDAVIESFLERVDREITARVDARVDARSGGTVSPDRSEPSAQLDSRRTLLTGVAIGILIACGPFISLITKSGPAASIFIPLFLVIAGAIAFGHSRSLRRRKPRKAA
jgi:hypothetical protein